MSTLDFRRPKTWLLTIAAITAVAVIYHVIDEELSRGREILGPDLRMSNLETFKEQLTRELPIGTPRREVETCLKRKKINYNAPPPDWYRGSISAGLPVRGWLLVLSANLAIDIKLNDDNKLEELRFKVEYK